MAEYVTREELTRHCEARHAANDKTIDILRTATNRSIEKLFEKIDKMNSLLVGCLASVLLLLGGVVVQLAVEQFGENPKPQPVEIRLTVDREGKLMGADK